MMNSGVRPVTGIVTSSSSSCQNSTSTIDHNRNRPPAVIPTTSSTTSMAMAPPIGQPFSTNLANSTTTNPSTNSSSHHHHQSGHHHHHHHNSNTMQTSASGHSATLRSGTGAGSTVGSITSNTTKGRRILIIRHGERVDFTFNISHDSWVSRAFDGQGRYKRFNINMPRTLPLRKDGFLAYATDTPLTEIGYLQAKLTGRALKEAGTKPTHVYVSPAYRSIQTCVGVLKGMQSQSQNVSFNIEPGLFEWGAWFRPKLPTWMTAEEYASQGYPVNVHYKPVIARTEITASESILDYYNRSYKVVQRVLERHPEARHADSIDMSHVALYTALCRFGEFTAAGDGIQYIYSVMNAVLWINDCVILFVAHGASLDTCTRQICGGPPRSQQDFYSILHQTPYLAMASAMEDVTSRTFRVVEPPILPFQHQGNASYDYRILNAQHVEKA